MRGLLVVTLLLLAFVPLAPTAGAVACETDFTLVGTDTNVWLVADAENPPLVACPGQSVTFNIEITGGTHNFIVQSAGQAAPGTPQDDPIGPFGAGEAEQYVWETPEAEGDAYTYICTIHAQTMAGTVYVAQERAVDEAGGEDDTPGFTLLAGVVALAAAVAVARRR